MIRHFGPSELLFLLEAARWTLALTAIALALDKRARDVGDGEGDSPVLDLEEMRQELDALLAQRRSDRDLGLEADGSALGGNGNGGGNGHG